MSAGRKGCWEAEGGGKSYGSSNYEDSWYVGSTQTFPLSRSNGINWLTPLMHPAEGWAPREASLEAQTKFSGLSFSLCPGSTVSNPCGSGKASAPHSASCWMQPAGKGQKAFFLEPPMKVYWSHWLWRDHLPILEPSTGARGMWPLGGALNRESISGIHGQVWLPQKHINGEGGKWLQCHLQKRVRRF